MLKRYVNISASTCVDTLVLRRGALSCFVPKRHRSAALLCRFHSCWSTKSQVLLLFILLVCAGAGRAEDWPQFLGPRANGISSETNLLEKWATNGPPLVWQKSIGTGYSAPSVRDGLLVLHHRAKDEEKIGRASCRERV